MTARQLQFIQSLATQKDLDGLTVEQRTFIGRVVAGEVEITPAQASRVIDAMLPLPVLASAVPTSAVPNTEAVEVREGRYAVVDGDNGVIKFYRVDRPTEGRWAGYTFVKVQASDEWFPVRDRHAKQVILATIGDDPDAAMRLYASELGRCGCCGRTLTDEVSRAAGIGPDCAEQHGIDRSVWAERAMAEARDRVRGEDPAPAAVEVQKNPVQPSVEVAEAQARIDEDEANYNAEFARSERAEHERAYAAEAAAEMAAARIELEEERRSSAPVRRDPSAGMTWRQRRDAVAAQQGERAPITGCSQNQDRPGCDIFGAPLA